MASKLSIAFVVLFCVAAMVMATPTHHTDNKSSSSESHEHKTHEATAHETKTEEGHEEKHEDAGGEHHDKADDHAKSDHVAFTKENHFGIFK